MPQALHQIHVAAAQLAIAYAVLAGILFIVSRQSISRLTAAPEFPEKDDLLRGARAHWMVVPLPGLGGLAVMLLILNLFLLPLTAVCANILIVLVTVVVLMFRDVEPLDGTFAGVEPGLTKDFDKWLQRHRRRVQRRRKLGWLRYVMVGLLILFVAVAAAGIATVDPVLAGRLHSMGVAEQVQQELGSQIGTIFSQTPPCVSLPTLYLIPTGKMDKAGAASAAELLAQALAKRQERQRWRIVVKTGDGSPLTERQYP